MNDVPQRPRNVRANTKNLATAATVDDAPSADIVANAPDRSVDIVDSTGRVLTIRFLKPLDRMRLIAAVGGELAKNEMYLGYAVLAASVTAINGDLIPKPRTVREIEFLVDRLGDEGLEAVGEGIKEHFKDKLKGPDVELAKN
jgi:hypothetical protein